MASSYPTPAKLCQVNIEVKRSKFIGFANNAANRDQAESFIRQLRVEHPQANHVCWAYIAGEPNTTIRSMSDDGEPSGTAGMPMLKVLEYSGFGDIVVAVVRYFGGIKLGTGGLQRAYSDTVSKVLAELPTQKKVPRTSIFIQYDYQHDGTILRLLQRYQVIDIVHSYQQKVTAEFAIATKELAQFKLELVNVTSGDVMVQTK